MLVESFHQLAGGFIATADANMTAGELEDATLAARNLIRAEPLGESAACRPFVSRVKIVAKSAIFRPNLPRRRF